MQKSLKIYLQLLMLLGRLIYNRSIMQPCPRESIFPNFTVVAGSPFYVNILLHTTPKHRRHLQISLANRKHLPSWAVYTHQTGHLLGLALPGDCGIHHFIISVANCTADLYVRVLNATVSSITRDTLPCPHGDMSVWGSLLLQVDPVSLNASRRIQMVDTVASHLRLQRESISLFPNTDVHPHNSIRACGRSNLKDKDFESNAVTEKSTLLLWPFGCKSQEEVFILQDKFQSAFEMGNMAKKLDLPVFAWRFLCAIEAAQKVKRDLRQQLSSLEVMSRESLHVPTLHIQLTSIIDTKQGTENTLGEMNSAMSNNLQSKVMKTAPSLTLDRSESDMSTLFSFELNITPLFSTPSAYTDRPTVMHAATGLQRRPTSLTSGRDLEATAIWTETYGYSHSESSAQAHAISQDHSEIRPDFSSTSVSSNSEDSFNSDHSLQSSKGILLTQTLSPSNINFSHSSITELYSQSVSPRAPGASQEEISQSTVSMTVKPLATSVSQTAQDELESSMHSSFTIEPTASTYTPPLPSEYSTSGHSSFTVQGLSMSLISQNMFMGSKLESEITNRSGLCFDQDHCRTIFPITEDSQMFSATFQALQTITTVSEQIYSMQRHSKLYPSSFINLFSESNHVSPHVSLQGSRAHAYFNTTQASTATTSLTATFQDQISTSEVTQTISDELQTTIPFSVQEMLSANSPITFNPTGLLTRGHSAPTQDIFLTFGNTSRATPVSQMTENELESSMHYPIKKQTLSVFNSALTYEHTTSELPSTSANLSPLLTLQNTSIRQDLSYIAFHSELSLETQAKSDRADSSDIVCQEQNGLSCVLVTSKLDFQTFPSTFEGLQSLSTARVLSEIEQTSFLTQYFTAFVSNVQNTMLFTAVDQVYEETLTVSFSNILFTTILPSEVYSSDKVSASDSYSSEEMVPSTVQNPSTASTIHLYESLEPSFTLCNSVESSLCASTLGSIFPETTVGDNYWTSYFGDSEFWTSEVGLSGHFFSTFGQKDSETVQSSLNPKRSTLETYFTILASTSSQSIQNYLSATYQMPPDTWTPSYMTSLSVLTYTLSPLSSSALIGHCPTDSRSLLKCQSSTHATAVGPQKQSTSFKFYSVVSTSTLLVSVGHSSLDIIKPSSSSPSSTVTSSINFPPEVSQTVPALTATIGFPFLYSIPQTTFVDPEEGAAHALSLQLTLIDPPPPDVGSWLSLDGLELHGIPLEIDSHYAPQRVLLQARDKGGLSTSTLFTIVLYRDPVPPCHVFTLTARLSLHSVLLRRHKMELFLAKLSGYFKATSYQHLAIVSINPGSIVVSWFNSILCGKGQCHYDKINSMWSEMSFENNTVRSKFRNTMLPEFPVINVEPVVYRKDCLPITQTPPATPETTSEWPTTSNFTTSTPIATTSKQVSSYDKMAAMFIALLVICSLILVVLFVAAILYFCQKRPRVVAIFPSSRMLSVRSRDLNVLRPRPALLLHPEIPPPPLRLWISLDEDDDDPQPSESPDRMDKMDKDPLQPTTKDKFSNI